MPTEILSCQMELRKDYAEKGTKRRCCFGIESASRQKHKEACLRLSE